MKIACILLTCLLSLPLFIGCEDTEESLDSLDSPISIQELPTDDDIAGLYNLGIPWDWYNVKDPVLYTKYFRAKLLREFGNAPEIHVIADMELKIRQRTYPVLDERITYLEAIYKFWSDEGILADLEYQRRARADGEPLVVIYGDDPEAHIIERLKEIYGLKLSEEAVITEIALIEGNKGLLQSLGWKVFPPVYPWEMRVWGLKRLKGF